MYTWEKSQQEVYTHMAKSKLRDRVSHKAIAKQWATMLDQKGIPVAAAKALGAYIGGLEKRLAELEQRITDLTCSSHKHD